MSDNEYMRLYYQAHKKRNKNAISRGSWDEYDAAVERAKKKGLWLKYSDWQMRKDF